MKLITTGCSFAGHTTHPLIEEESWSVQLTKRLNLNKSQVLNMGLGGCSLDYIYRSVIHGAIENLNKDLTILIIAHRLTTLKGCDKIVKFDSNHTIHTGTYQEIIDAGV